MGKLREIIKGHKIVGIDTNCFIYYFEGGTYAKTLKEDLFLPLEKGEFHGVTSVLNIAELLVRPKALQREDVAEEYTLLLSTYPNLEIAPFTLSLADSCAEIRAGYKLRTPDAIQAATALEKEATLFLTNDAGFPSHIGQMAIRILSDFLGEK